MKVFKLILILVLLFSMSVFGQPTTLEHTLEIPETWKWDFEDKTVIFQKHEPDTLLEWFKNLTLDEKVEIYNWWKNKDIPDVFYHDIYMPLIIDDSGEGGEK